MTNDITTRCPKKPQKPRSCGARQHVVSQRPTSQVRVCIDLETSTVVRDLGIYLDSDVSMRSQVAWTVSNCFSIVRRLRSIRRSLTRSVFQSIVVALVLSKLDFGNATLAGLPLYQLRRLQSVMNAAAQLVFSVSRYDQIMHLYFTGCTGFVHHSEYLSIWQYSRFAV